MARLADARGRIARLSGFLDETLELFIDPSEDKDKTERGELLDAIVEEAGELSRVIEEIQDNGWDFTDVDPDSEGDDEGDEAA